MFSTQQVENTEANIQEKFQYLLKELEEALVLNHEIPMLIKEKQEEIEEIKLHSSYSSEREEKPDEEEEETKSKIEIISQEIKDLENVKTKEEFKLITNRNTHLILIYTNSSDHFWHGSIDSFLRKSLDKIIYRMIQIDNSILSKKDKVYILIDTHGGSGLDALEMYDILNDVFLDPSAIIADEAWSAGTIFSLCCHSILMLQNSLLGSIDTQIRIKGSYLSAFSYIEGIHKYLDKIIDLITEDDLNSCSREKLLKKRSVADIIPSLLECFDIHAYGECHNVLDQIANGVAIRHVEHDTTYNDFAGVKDGIWINFIHSGKTFGHAHGFNSNFLRRFYRLDDKPMFLEDYIYSIGYEDKCLYELVGKVDSMIEEIFSCLNQSGLSAYSLVINKDVCKITTTQ